LSFTAASNAAPKVVRITDVQPLKADTESTRRNLGGAALHRDDRIVWVHDHRNPCGSRHCFLQKRQTLLGKIQEHEANACHVAAWPGQVCDKARRNRISDLDHDNAVGEPSLSDEVPSLSSQPRSRSPCRKDSQEAVLVSRDWAVSTPIRTGLRAC
jgi:hypothetical protein